MCIWKQLAASEDSSKETIQRAMKGFGMDKHEFVAFDEWQAAHLLQMEHQ